MAGKEPRSRKEARKPRKEIPEVPDLGRLSMPRKTNRAAAKYIAEKGALWDRRRVDRKARKRALLQQDAAEKNPRRKHLDKVVRQAMLASMPSWSFDHKKKAFAPLPEGATPDGLASPSQVEELVDALAALLPGDAPAIRVRKLPQGTYARVRGYLDTSTLLIQVQ